MSARQTDSPRLCILASETSAEYDPAPFFGEYEWEMHTLEKTTSVRQIEQLAQRGFDVFVNLCDGALGEDSPGIEVVQALERLGVPFTGATSAFYEPTREMMKRACHARGILAPAGMQVKNPSEVEHAARALRFPLIVKHPNSYSSIGLTRESRVENAEQLARQAEIMIGEFGGTLIEEFIEGREFTVLVAENPDTKNNPTVYLPMEFLFPPTDSFKHEELKWVRYEEMTCVLCEDAELGARLKVLSRALFVEMNGSGYARCDIRMNARGELFLLEINPNCGVFFAPHEPGSADYALLQDVAGHRGFVEQILRAALARHSVTARPVANGNSK